MEAAHKQRDGWSDGEIKSSDMHKVLQMDGGGGKGRERNEEGKKLKEGEKKGGKQPDRILAPEVMAWASIRERERERDETLWRRREWPDERDCVEQVY